MTWTRASRVRLAAAGALAAAAALTPLPACTLRAQGAPFTGLDAYVVRAVKEWEVPGLAIAVVRNDSIVFAKGYGVRTLGKPEPVDAHTLFAVGSTTKAMTVTALAMLVDEGKVRWDDPVTKHLPQLQLADPYVTRELTVRDLLTHRSGLGTVDAIWYATPNSFDEIARRLRYLPPASSLRSRFAYQNVMYATAGQVVAAASGKSWDAFLRERLFAPLGMTETNTSVAALAALANVAAPHDRVDDTVRAVPYRSLDNIAPAGAVNSSILDMARWVRFQLDSGRASGRRLVQPATFAEMFTPQVIVPPAGFYPTMRLTKPHFVTYGLGWFLHDYRGRAVAMHTGSIDGMSAIIGMIPEERVGVVVLANLDHAELRHALMYRVLDMALGPPARDWSTEMRAMYGTLTAQARSAERARDSMRVTGTRPSLALERYAGTYADSLYGEATVRVENGVLVLQVGSGRVGELAHWHYDTFRARWRDRALGNAFVTFSVGPDGRARAMEVEGVTTFGRVVGGGPR